MTAWDRYRGGIEYLIYMAERHGQLDLSGDKRSKLAQACGEFTAIRMSVAMRLWAARKEFIKAYELYTRICLAGLDKHPDILRLKEQLPLMASLQILARKVNTVSGLRYLVLDAFPDVRTVGGVLKELGLDPAIEVIATPENPTAEIADAAAVGPVPTGELAQVRYHAVQLRRARQPHHAALVGQRARRDRPALVQLSD